MSSYVTLTMRIDTFDELINDLRTYCTQLDNYYDIESGIHLIDYLYDEYDNQGMKIHCDKSLKGLPIAKKKKTKNTKNGKNMRNYSLNALKMKIFLMMMGKLMKKECTNIRTLIKLIKSSKTIKRVAH